MASSNLHEDGEVEIEESLIATEDTEAENPVDPNFHAQLRQHLITHSRGSSINLSFDLSTSSSSSEEPDSEGDEFRERFLNDSRHIRLYIREKLRYHFMSPLEKWRSRRIFPWKLIFQVFKIFFVTFQILLFGMDSTQFYKEEAATATALKAYFLTDWDPIRDVYFYPPTDGPYAVYTLTELFDSIDTVVQRYANITEEPIGSFRYNSKNGSLVPPQLCIEFYEIVRVFPFNSSISFNNKVMYRCLLVNPPTYDNFSIVKFLNETAETLDLQRLISARINFTLRTVYRRSRPIHDYFVAYRMDTSIIYDNLHHDGMIKVSLQVGSATNEREKISDESTHPVELLARQALNAFILVLCSVSLFLCIRSMLRCYSLSVKTKEFFISKMDTRLGLSDRLEFVDFWLCLIVLNDILVISGTIIKITIDLQMISKTRFMYASVLLGTGLLLVWCGVIRYLGYLRTYNVLILTLKKSTPNLLKFLIGAMILFIGYATCGWVVLGPHHIKFKTFSTSMECLYAITNGDDIFATFSLARDEYASHHLSSMIWWFTRFYLYSFVILFICVVINLLYAVIIDAYESIKEMADENKIVKKSLIMEFIDERLEKASSVNYILDEEIEGQMNTCEFLLCCCPSWLKWSTTPASGTQRSRRFSRRHSLLEEDDEDIDGDTTNWALCILCCCPEWLQRWYMRPRNDTPGSRRDSRRHSRVLVRQDAIVDED